MASISNKTDNYIAMNTTIHLLDKLSQAKGWVKTFFEARSTFYKKRNLPSFSLCAAIEQFLIMLIIFFILGVVTTINEPTFVKKWSKQEFIILATVLAPIGETIIFQFVIIELLKRFKVNTFLCGLVSAFIFGSAHIDNSQYSFYFVTLGGLYLSWGYNLWATRSRFKAVFSTILQHSLFNSLTCLVIFF